MENVNDIIYKLMSSVQMVLNVLVSLVFQPVYSITAIIDGLVQIWSPEEEEETEQQQVTILPSTNEGRHSDEWNYPIGFKINQSEVDEIKKVKEELYGKQ